MVEAMQHTEAGVTYSRNRWPTLEPIPNHFTLVEYNWFHKATGKSGTSKIWIENTRHVENDLKKLTDHWSRGDYYQYTPLPIPKVEAPATVVAKQTNNTRNKQMPKFQHDCDTCTFLGTFFDHDVYHCGNNMGNGSIIARYGSDGPEYASMPLDALKSSLQRNGNIGGTDENGQPWTMKYQDWIFSERSIPSTSAMILALALKTIG